MAAFYTILGVFMLFPIAVAFIALGVFFYKRDYEWEYSYFDGDVRFAKIINKNKRKDLKSYNMEDVTVFAPIDDRSMYNYLNDNSMKVRDFTTGFSNRKVYGMVVKGENGRGLIKFERDEKYLDAVCIKYRQKVIR